MLHAKETNSVEDVEDAVTAVQDGDVDTMRQMLSSRLVTANVKDRDQCTLLHWAAINNRVQISKLLIQYGADAVPGGVLRETPLQWALRKKYYTMMALLHERLKLDFTHKSSQGLDAIHLACRLEDMDGLFLLLSWGASPNAVDDDGNTPILWFLKSKLTAKGKEMIKLLIQFGADANAMDKEGNTAMHVLAMNKKSDLSLAFHIYQSGGYRDAMSRNKDDLTPYSLAVQSQNRPYARFLFDILVMNFLPYWSPTVVIAFLLLAMFILLQRYGYFWGMIYYIALHFGCVWTMLQSSIVDHRGRYAMGMLLGASALLLWTTYTNVFPSISFFMRWFYIVVVLATIFVAHQFRARKPISSKVEAKSELAQKITMSSPSEGTDEENELAHREESAHDANQLIVAKCTGKIVLIRDSFTGRLQRVPRENIEAGLASHGSSEEIRVRNLGPRICGICVVDKRSFLHHCPTPRDNSPGAGNRKSSASTTTIASHDESNISMAKHCYVCKLCVVDQDHHSPFLSNCVGKGNRRLFFVFTVLAACLGVTTLILLRWAQYNLLCTGFDSSTWMGTLEIESCLFFSYPHIFLTQFVALGFFFQFVVFAHLQLVCVARETTVNNVNKGRILLKPPSMSRQLRNVLHFLRTGHYTVTYPKEEDHVQGSCSRRSSSSEHTHGVDDRVAKSLDRAEKGETEVDESVRRLLAHVEEDMHGHGPTDLTAVSASLGALKIPVSTASGSGKAAGPTAVAVKAAPQPFPRKLVKGHLSTNHVNHAHSQLSTPTEAERMNRDDMRTAGAVITNVSRWKAAADAMDDGSTVDFETDDDAEDGRGDDDDDNDDDFDSELVESEYNAYRHYYWKKESETGLSPLSSKAEESIVRFGSRTPAATTTPSVPAGYGKLVR